MPELAAAGPLDDFVGAVLERRKHLPTNEGDREFFITELKILRERLASAEARSEELTATNSELTRELKKQKEDQADIFEYLNGQITEKTTTIMKLEESVHTLEEEVASITNDMESKLLLKEEEAAAQREVSSKQIDELRVALEELNDFQKHKEGLERESAETKRSLEEERQVHQRELSDLERHHVQEKDRLKREMLVKLKETKTALNKLTADQLDMTTKRTIAENAQMSTELAWQSKETERLMRRGDVLGEENKKLKREVALHKQTEEEFARKSNGFQQTIQTLLARLNETDATSHGELSKLNKAAEDSDRALAVAQTQVEALREEVTQLQEEKDRAQESVSRLQEDLIGEKELRRREAELMDDGIRFIHACFQDIERSPSSRYMGARGVPQYTRHLTSRARPSTNVRSPATAGGVESETTATEEGPTSTLDELTRLASPRRRRKVLDELLTKLDTFQKQMAMLAMQDDWRQATASKDKDMGIQLPRTRGAVPPAHSSAHPSTAPGCARSDHSLVFGLRERNGRGQPTADQTSCTRRQHPHARPVRFRAGARHRAHGSWGQLDHRGEPSGAREAMGKEVEGLAIHKDTAPVMGGPFLRTECSSKSRLHAHVIDWSRSYSCRPPAPVHREWTTGKVLRLTKSIRVGEPIGFRDVNAPAPKRHPTASAASHTTATHEAHAHVHQALDRRPCCVAALWCDRGGISSRHRRCGPRVHDQPSLHHPPCSPPYRRRARDGGRGHLLCQQPPDSSCQTELQPVPLHLQARQRHDALKSRGRKVVFWHAHGHPDAERLPWPADSLAWLGMAHLPFTCRICVPRWPTPGKARPTTAADRFTSSDPVVAGRRGWRR